MMTVLTHVLVAVAVFGVTEYYHSKIERLYERQLTSRKGREQ